MTIEEYRKFTRNYTWKVSTAQELFNDCRKWHECHINYTQYKNGNGGYTEGCFFRGMKSFDASNIDFTGVDTSNMTLSCLDLSKNKSITVEQIVNAGSFSGVIFPECDATGLDLKDKDYNFCDLSGVKGLTREQLFHDYSSKGYSPNCIRKSIKGVTFPSVDVTGFTFHHIILRGCKGLIGVPNTRKVKLGNVELEVPVSVNCVGTKVHNGIVAVTNAQRINSRPKSYALKPNALGQELEFKGKRYQLIGGAASWEPLPYILKEVGGQATIKVTVADLLESPDFNNLFSQKDLLVNAL